MAPPAPPSEADDRPAGGRALRSLPPRPPASSPPPPASAVAQHTLGSMDGWSTALALLAGVANGSYPLFLKTAAVLAADIHMIVFQSFKSTTLLLLGLVLVGSQALVATADYTFTWWAVAGAAAWIPSGLTTIAAVPMIGMGPTMLTAAGTGTVVSFFVGWLALGEPLRHHHTSTGSTFVLAPMYLLGILLGMVGLVFAPQIFYDAAASKETHEESDTARVFPTDHVLCASQHDPRPLEQGSVPQTRARKAASALRPFGYFLAASSGGFASLQYLIVTLAQRNLPVDSVALDPLGSWTLSFAIGAVVWTMVAAGVFAALNRFAHVPTWRRRAIWKVVAIPGLGAGLFWCGGNLLSTLAVERGGNAVTVATYQTANLITSGMWGLLFYHEFRGRAAVAWALSAAFTMVMVLLLALEKGH